MLTAARPPSTHSVVPVIHAASREARKATAAAMSSGSPTRPRGWIPDAWASIVVAASPDDGADRARRDQVDLHTDGRRAPREGAGEGHEAGLAAA